MSISSVRPGRNLGIGIAGAALALVIMSPAAQAEPISMDDSNFERSAQSLFMPNMGAVAENKPITAETVVATVSGEKILFGQLQERLQAILANVPPNVPPAAIQQQIPRILSDSLNGMIVEKLLAAAIEDEAVEVSEVEVDAKIAEIEATQIPEGQKLSELLAAQNIDMDDFKDRIEDELAVNKLIDAKVPAEAEVSAEQVEEFYAGNKEQFVQPETVSASHILIAFEEDDDEVAKDAKLSKIKELRAKIVADEVDFDKAAEDHSSCPSSAQGGSLGQFARGQMVPAFEEVAFTQDVGEVSEPVETNFGYHLIVVEERVDGKTVPLEEARDDIEKFLAQSERQQRVGAYIESLREQADVEIEMDFTKVQMSPPAGNTAK